MATSATPLSRVETRSPFNFFKNSFGKSSNAKRTPQSTTSQPLPPTQPKETAKKTSSLKKLESFCKSKLVPAISRSKKVPSRPTTAATPPSQTNKADLNSKIKASLSRLASGVSKQNESQLSEMYSQEESGRPASPERETVKKTSAAAALMHRMATAKLSQSKKISTADKLRSLSKSKTSLVDTASISDKTRKADDENCDEDEEVVDIFEEKLRVLVPAPKFYTSNPGRRYVGAAKVGRGANGAVIKTTKKSNGNTYAIKRAKVMADDIRQQNYVLREIKIMLNAYPNILSLREVGYYQGEAILTMDCMACSVFGLLCVLPDGLPEPLALMTLRDTANGLNFLVKQGFFHRDVKCENILLSWTGHIKLADFGLAASLSHRNTARLGTARWMAPEVIREEQYDEKVDIWSLGICLIEMLDRVPPRYEWEDEQAIHQSILNDPPPSFQFSQPSMSTVQLLESMLDLDPAARPSAMDVIKDIDFGEDKYILGTYAEMSRVVRRYANRIPV